MVDSVVIGQQTEAPAVTPEEQVHQDKMAQVAEGDLDPKNVDNPTRPDDVPEKFWDNEKGTVNQEALLQSYRELEGKLNAPVDKTPEDSGTDVDDLGIQEPSSDDFMDKLSQEWADNGELSAESYKAIEDSYGFDKDFVDNYIAGQQARVDNIRNSAFEVVGGEQNYMTMIEWAKVNLSPSEIAALNQNLQSTNIDSVKTGVEALSSKYKSANGQRADLVSGDKSGGSDGFRSWAEVTEAMRDPRYKKDHAYRADVEAKVAASNNL